MWSHSSTVVVTIILALVSKVHTSPVATVVSHPTDIRILYIAVQALGILTLEFDPSKPANTSISILETNTQGGYRPGWLRLYADKLYSISRTQYPTGNSTSASSESGDLFSFERRCAKPTVKHSKPQDYSIERLNSVSSGGFGGVYCDVSRDGRTLTAANIDGSSISVHPLESNGSIGKATYVFNFTLDHPGPGAGDSQTQSNPHETIFEPSGQFFFSPDRGADLLRVYRVKGPSDVNLYQTITLDPGTGPRHLTFRIFSATRTYMYLVSEIDNTVRVFTLDGVLNNIPLQKSHSPKLQIAFKQLISTVGLGTNRTAPTNDLLAAEVALSTDGKFCYVSNRNTISYDPDDIAVFSVHPAVNNDLSHLVYLGNSSTYGKIPRHFSLSPDIANQYAAVANEVTNDLVILERDEKSGFFTKLRGNISFGDFDVSQTQGPTAVVWT